MRNNFFASVLVIVFGFTGHIQAGDASGVNLDLQHPSRTVPEKARDINRMPNETLSFFGLKPTMKVIELFPGSGWYTKLLGPYLEEQGELYIALNTGRIAEKLDALGLNKVKVTGEVENFTKTDFPGYIFSADSIDLQQRDVDMVLTFRNAHNLTADARTKLNQAAFDALKPGGVYGVIDHTRRHMVPLNAETWRRVDPVEIIHEALAVGFEFAGFSPIHARQEDSLGHDTKHESLVNESDRFTLKFVKPE